MKKERKLMKYHGPHHGIDEGVWSVTPSSAYTIHDKYDHCMNEIFSFSKIYKIFRNKIKKAFRKMHFFRKAKKDAAKATPPPVNINTNRFLQKYAFRQLQN